MYSTDGGNVLYYTKSHIIRFGIFFLLFLVMSFIHTRFWYTLGYIFYAISLFMLVWALYFGVSVSGSQRWIDLYFLNFQPSELMKIAIIVSFSKYYHRVQSSDVQHIKYIIQPIILLILPIFLVISQPDLGTSILIALTGISVMWLAGLNVKYFVYSALLFLVTAPFVISILKPYQKIRILTFLNPERDPLGAGYQINQSKIAVGSGGLYGKGFLKGFGFIGSVLLLLLYALLIYRIILIGLAAKSSFAKFYCFGFASAIFIYISINMSMVLGLLPIIGSPLPIMSYGGSSMLATMIGLSIVMSCKIYRKELII